MNNSDVPRRRHRLRAGLAALLAGVMIAAGGYPEADAGTSDPAPVATSTATPGQAPAVEQTPVPLTKPPGGQTADQQAAPGDGPAPGSGPAAPPPSVDQPAGNGSVPAPGPDQPPAAEPEQPATKPEQPGNGTGSGRPDSSPADGSAPTTNQPKPSEPGPDQPDPDQPDTGVDTETETGPGAAGGGSWDSGESDQPAQLRLVQAFNVPKADFGRFWTLSAKQGERTVFGGRGPEVPARGFANVPAGAATVLSARMDPGWSQAADVAAEPAWSCRDERSGEGVAVRGGDTLGSLEPGQRVLCVAAVQLRDGPLSVTKSAVTLTQDPAGRWNLGYEIRVINTSRTADAGYGLTDTLDFGPGIGIVSAAWTRLGTQPRVSGSWPDTDRNRTQTLAAPGTAIGHSSTGETVHTYHVSAVVTVDEDTAAAALECRPGDEASGGLRSTAVLNSRIEASACRTVPVGVQVDKVWTINGTDYLHGSRPGGFGASLRLSTAGAVQLAGEVRPEHTQQWGTAAGGYRPGADLDVTESLTLPEGCEAVRSSGTGTQQLSAALNRLTVRTVVECTQRLTLVHTLAPAELAGRLSGKWTLTATPEGAVAPELSGTSGASGEVQAGRTYRLDDAPAFLGDQEFAAEPWRCRLDSGSGKLVQQGSSVVPGYGQHITCTVANTWQGPGLEVSKNAGNPAPVPGTAGTQWEVVYGVSIKNPSMVSPARYTLVDWLAFGQGVEIVSARWMLPAAGLSGRWTEPGSLPLETLAAGRAIDVMDSHDYLVTVRVRVKPGTAVEDLDCRPEDSGQTGMMNMVALNGGTVVQACAALDHLVRSGPTAEGGVLVPPGPGPGSGPADAPAKQANAPGLVRLSPVLAVSSIDQRGVVTAAAMLLLSAALVLFLSRPRRH
ncbi:hypothetical protein [Arthrobacter mobilis]|uniref:Uncharacterized protein n=1 Tax=Arthrobacter mobilis TaxID=2724944 RepID=A0A7X6K2L3_9MICC|nr:hypothetical protein [Arthrobacter mobilis]NKX53317.1 hypothetical protein [Arthrobacter mobilis]